MTYRLEYQPPDDSLAHGESARQRLQLERRYAIWLGETAARLSPAEGIHDADGPVLDLGHAIGHAVEHKESIRPDELVRIPDAPKFASTRIRVVNDTTLAVARRMSERDASTAALNFANGVEPGGGFLMGSLAQEETLCRSSALYATLVGDPMYEAHRSQELPPESSAWIIRSPRVPVFRSDDGKPEAAPWRADFLTCAAPLATLVGQPRSHELLDRRIHRMFEVAVSRGHASLVLGAWGCGAFRNDPEVVAVLFRRHLETFAGHFREVVFAITDWSEDRRTFRPFARTLADRV